jgi:hypothetical protein
LIIILTKFLPRNLTQIFNTMIIVCKIPRTWWQLHGDQNIVPPTTSTSSSKFYHPGISQNLYLNKGGQTQHCYPVKKKCYTYFSKISSHITSCNEWREREIGGNAERGDSQFVFLAHEKSGHETTWDKTGAYERIILKWILNNVWELIIG